MSRVARDAAGMGSGGAAGGAAGCGGAGLSRLASTGRSGAAAAADDDMPSLMSSSGEESEGDLPDMPELVRTSSSSEGEEAPAPRPGSRAAAGPSPGSSGGAHSAAGSSGQAAAAAAEEEEQGGSPPRRRARRNAVFGRLPGLAGGLTGGSAAPAGVPSVSSHPLLGMPSSPSSSEAGSDRGSAPRRTSSLAPYVLRARRQQRGSSGSQPASGGEQSAASDSEGLPGLRSDTSDSEGGSSSSGDQDEGVPGLISDGSSGYTSSDAMPRSHPRRGSAAAAGLGPRCTTADQRAVMQALATLLPAQQDATGWAELARHVQRHAGSSGGGVQLLSRLVASAASQFPAEAEAAGLTERPLGPPPSAAATAAGSPSAAAASRAFAGSADAASGATIAPAAQPEAAARPSSNDEGNEDGEAQNRQIEAMLRSLLQSADAGQPLAPRVAAALARLP